MPRRLQAWLGVLWLILGVACLLLVMVYAAAAAAQSQEPKPPTTLWGEYPVDPAPSSEQGSPPAPPASPSAPATTQQQPSTPARAPEPADDGSSPSLRLGILAGFGLAVLLAAVSALSVLVPTRGRRKERRAPAAAKPKAKATPEPKVKAKSEPKIKPKSEQKPKPTAKKPKQRQLFRRQRPSRAASQQAPTASTLAAATPEQRALPVKAAEAAAAPASSPLPAATPREREANGNRAELLPARQDRQEAPAARQPEPRPTDGARPNGAPATTWFTQPHEGCEITLWRGYMRAQFYARPTFPEPGDYAIEVSPKFRLRGETPKARGSALAAYERLIEQLVRRGWEPSGLGGQWFEQWFRRRLPAGQGLAPMEPAPPAQTPSGRS